MTRKITISLPDDVADQLEGLPNVSAYITDALRQRAIADQSRQMLVDAGFDITAEQIAEARARRLAALATVTDSAREQAEALRALVNDSRHVPAGGPS